MSVTKHDYLRKQEVLKLWGQIVDLFATKSSVTTLEGYFNASGYAKRAVADQNGLTIDTSYLKLTGGTLFSSDTLAPLTIKGGSGMTYAGINFMNSAGTSLGALYAQMQSSTPRLTYYNGTDYAIFYTDLNSNKSDVSWTANNLTVHGWIRPSANNNQDIGEQDHTFNNLYINNIVTAGSYGIRFGANNGPFRWYNKRTSFSSYTPTMELSKAGDLSVYGGISANGICDLSLN